MRAWARANGDVIVRYIRALVEGRRWALDGIAKDAGFDMEGFRNVLKLRAEIEGQMVFAMAPARDASVYGGIWGWLWPNLGINVYRHGYMIERMTATGPAETRLDYLYFFDPARAAELAAMLKVSDLVTAQDLQVCEEVQRNLEAGVYPGGVLSPRHETGVAWFQGRVAEARGL